MFGTLEEVLANRAQVCFLQGDSLGQLRFLPPGSIHFALTSPPYYSQRDYQTGTWVGGNEPDCQHLGPPRQSQSSTLRGNGHGGDKPLSPRLQRMNSPQGAVCGKCGARRVDHQLGLEERPFCDEVLLSPAARVRY